jgi:hypothetical protein
VINERVMLLKVSSPVRSDADLAASHSPHSFDLGFAPIYQLLCALSVLSCADAACKCKTVDSPATKTNPCHTSVHGCACLNGVRLRYQAKGSYNLLKTIWPSTYCG